MRSCLDCRNINTTKCVGCIGGNRFDPIGDSTSEYIDTSISKELLLLTELACKEHNKRKSMCDIEKVIFNAPATIVIWKDGSKTIVKSGDYDVFDPEKGLAMAIAKKALGNKGNYYEVFKKWLPEEEEIKELPESLKKLIDEITIKPEFIHAGKCVEVTITDETIKEVERFENEDSLELLTPEELAEKLGCTKATIQKQCRQGLHPGAVKVGGKWKIPY